MKNKKPPFEINKKIMTEAIEIAELDGGEYNADYLFNY